MINSQNITKFTKRISTNINQQELQNFASTIAQNGKYKITSNTYYYIFHNETTQEYEIILFDSTDENFFCEFEIFSRAYLLFDIPIDGWRVFIYQKGIFLYFNGQIKFYKIFDTDFSLDEIDIYLSKTYKIDNFEYTYIKQNQYETLLNSNDKIETLEYKKLNQSRSLTIFLIFLLTITILILYTIYLILTNKQTSIEVPITIDEKIITNQNSPQNNSFAKTINQFFITLNSENILLQSLHFDNDVFKATITSKDKDKLLKLENNNIEIKKFIYDKISNQYIMEIEFDTKIKHIL